MDDTHNSQDDLKARSQGAQANTYVSSMDVSNESALGWLHAIYGLSNIINGLSM